MNYQIIVQVQPYHILSGPEPKFRRFTWISTRGENLKDMIERLSKLAREDMNCDDDEVAVIAGLVEHTVFHVQAVDGIQESDARIRPHLFRVQVLDEAAQAAKSARIDALMFKSVDTK